MVVTKQPVQRPTRQIDPATGQAISATEYNSMLQDQQYQKQLAANQAQTVESQTNPDGSITGKVTSSTPNAALSPFQPLPTSPAPTATSGVIDQTAYNRLIASGMSESEAKAKIEGNRTNVQQAFTQVGTGITGSQAVLDRGMARLDPRASAREEEIAGIPKTIQVVTGTDKNGNPIISTIQDPNYAANVAATKARHAQEDMTAATQRQTEQKNVAGRNAGEAKSEESKQSDAPVQDTSKIDKISTMLDGIIAASGDPMGPVYKEMMLQEFQDMEEAKANAALSRDASIARAEEQNTDVQALLDKYTQIHKDNNKAYTKLLDETRDSTQKYLDEQKQRDIDRLTWEGDMESQKLTRQKTQQLLSQSIQNALSGGAFSGAANEQLAATEREWDTAIANLAKEYSFKKTDVSAFYTQKYIDTNNQFNLDVFNAAKELDSKIEGYAIQGFNSLQAMENAKTAAQNEYRTTIDAAKKEYSNSIKGYVKEMQTTMKEERVMKEKTKDALWDRLFTQRAQDGNLNPTLTRSILRQMEEAGIDTSGIDPDAMTESQVNEMRRSAAIAQKEATDAKGRPMTQGQVTQIASMNDALSLLANVKQSILTDFKDVGGPISGRLGSLPGAELFSENAARIKEFNSKVALVKQIIGKALEGGVLRKEDEEKYKHILPNINDTDRIRATKLENLRQTIENQRNGYIRDASLGGYDTSGYDIGDPIQNPEVPSLTDDEVMDIMDKLDRGEPITFSADNAGKALASLGSKETQNFTTPLNPKLYSQSTIKAWNGQHKGIDIAMPPGTPIPTTVAGEVIAAQYEKGWGNTIVIRAADGSEHRYSHLDGFDVKKGDKVRPGQVVAVSGGAKGAKGAGTSTGPHLDYRIKVKGQYIDPYTYKISTTS